MPSIPQSLLWISLVVLWLFVLVPMLINKRDTVRRTSDVALATRVLNGAARSRLIKRSGPATGHRHDPDWQPVDQFAEEYPDLFDEVTAEPADYADHSGVIRKYDDAVREARMGAGSQSVMVVAAVAEGTWGEPDYLDVDVVEENSGALPVGGVGMQVGLFKPPQQASEPVGQEPVGDSGADAGAHIESRADAEPEAAEPEASEPGTAEPEAEPVSAVAESEAGPPAPSDGSTDEYEYIDDSSGLETEEEPVPPTPRSSSRQRRLSTTAAAAVSARKYRFRKRLLMVMAALMALTAVLTFTVSPTLWWSCGAVAGVTVLYLAYLRRQTRIEEQVRRRRQQRMARSRPLAGAMDGERSTPAGPKVDSTEFPTRLRRPGVAVLEIDDEDPIFEHLDEAPYSRRHYGMSRGVPGGLPRASGQ